MININHHESLDEFHKWFDGVEAGDDLNWSEPEYASDEWFKYVERMQLAKGAWQAALQYAVSIGNKTRV